MFTTFAPRLQPIRLPGWWNGRHEGLKIPWLLQPCGFKSRFGHQYKKAVSNTDTAFFTSSSFVKNCDEQRSIIRLANDYCNTKAYIHNRILSSLFYFLQQHLYPINSIVPPVNPSTTHPKNITAVQVRANIANAINTIDCIRFLSISSNHFDS